MLSPKFLEKVEDYLERKCFDKKWFKYRKNLGKPVNSRKNMQDSSTEAHIGKNPPSISDEERAKTLETHRNYFANYFFDLMEQKNFSESEIAAKARVDAAIFSRLRNDKRYLPAERTIWALALALELNLDEANALLSRAPYTPLKHWHYFLSANIMEEVLIAFFLDNKIYDLSLADEILTHYGLETLEIREDFSENPDDKTFPDKNLIDSIDLYVEKIFFDWSVIEAAGKRGVKFSICGKSLGEPAESLKTFEVIIRALKDKIGLSGNYFSDYLFKLIKQKNLTDVEVYKRAHLDRRIFSKIRNEKSYMPAKKTVLAIAFAMKLDFREANTLLARAGYFLSDGRKEDVIAAYFIENQIYDLFLINEVMDYYDCPILGD